MKFFQLALVVILFQSCTSQTKKINGVSFVAASDSIAQKHVTPVVNLNANYAALMPFSLLKSIDSPTVYYNQERQWFGETKDGLKQYAKWLRKNDIKLMLKPQIWVWNGEFTGTITMNSEADWIGLEESYSAFILDYAQVAQDLNAEIYCIGTELELFVKNRPEYWKGLIKEVRKVYSGKLTYAANWNEYKMTSFWSDLDFIGIDAYFPLSDNKTPTLEECLAGWKKHKPTIKSYSDKYKKPILFTEFGYRSVDYAAKKPWVYSREMTEVNHDAQVNAIKALFQTFWDEPWFSGGFAWKWFHKHDTAGGLENNQFTPQNKPVEAIYRNHYKAFETP